MRALVKYPGGTDPTGRVTRSDRPGSPASRSVRAGGDAGRAGGSPDRALAGGPGGGDGAAAAGRGGPRDLRGRLCWAGRDGTWRASPRIREDESLGRTPGFMLRHPSRDDEAMTGINAGRVGPHRGIETPRRPSIRTTGPLMLTDQNIEAELSYAYLHAVALEGRVLLRVPQSAPGRGRDRCHTHRGRAATGRRFDLDLVLG